MGTSWDERRRVVDNIREFIRSGPISRETLDLLTKEVMNNTSCDEDFDFAEELERRSMWVEAHGDEGMDRRQADAEYHRLLALGHETEFCRLPNNRIGIVMVCGCDEAAQQVQCSGGR